MVTWKPPGRPLIWAGARVANADVFILASMSASPDVADDVDAVVPVAAPVLPGPHGEDAPPVAAPSRVQTAVALVLVIVGLSGINERVIAAAGWSTGEAIAWYAALFAIGALYFRVVRTG